MDSAVANPQQRAATTSHATRRRSISHSINLSVSRWKMDDVISRRRSGSHINSTQLNSSENYGRRCSLKHAQVRVRVTKLVPRMSPFHKVTIGDVKGNDALKKSTTALSCWLLANLYGNRIDIFRMSSFVIFSLLIIIISCQYFLVWCSVSVDSLHRRNKA